MTNIIGTVLLMVGLFLLMFVFFYLLFTSQGWFM